MKVNCNAAQGVRARTENIILQNLERLRGNRRAIVGICLIGLACLSLAGCRTSAPAGPQEIGLVGRKAKAVDPAPQSSNAFCFITAGDMRNFTASASAGQRYFDGACEALQSIGAGAFMISPGDCDPPAPVRTVIDHYLGTNYVWYPVIGNHEAGNPTNMVWLQRWARAGIPHLTRAGPPGTEETTYSFEFANSHFIVLNEYYDGHSATIRKEDLPEATFDWLARDLAATRKPLIWVIGHVPIRSLPDMDTGRLRHEGESLATNPARLERFLQLLKQHHARAYICGHTHDCSIAKINGVWQADSGHVRGAGDKGAPSTFLKFRISGTRTWVDIYRADPEGVHYTLRRTVELD